MTSLLALPTAATREMFLDAADELLDEVGPAAFTVHEVAVRLGWPVDQATVLGFPSVRAVGMALLDRARGVYAFRLRAAGLQPAVVEWLLDHDPTTALGLAYALDRTGGEDAWDLPIGFIPVSGGVRG